MGRRRRSYACFSLRRAPDERITAAEHPKQVLRSSATRNVILERSRLVGLCCVGGNRRIEFPSVVNNQIGSVASTRHIYLVIDNPIRESTCRMRKRNAPGEIGPGVCHWIVFPSVRLSAVDRSTV